MPDAKPKILGLPRNVAIFGGVGALAVLGYLWYRNKQASANASSQDSSSAQGGYSGAFAPAPALAYGANLQEIVTTVNGPSAGAADDDDSKKPGKKPPAKKPPAKKPPTKRPPVRKPILGNQRTSSAPAGTASPASSAAAAARVPGPAPAPTRGPASKPPATRAPARRAPARKRKKTAA